MELTNIIIAVLFVFLAVIIRYGKVYWLIAGYNTMTKKQKEQFDIEGFALLFYWCFIIMGLLIGGGQYLLKWLGWKEAPLWIILIATGIILPILLIGGQKFDHNKS